MNRKTILVCGATGAQGGSVAAHLLKRGTWSVRCLTRNPHAERAAALRRAGAEIIPGDWQDPRSLRVALEGCRGVFGISSYWEHFGNCYELGKNLIDAVVAANVDHIVLSSLPYAKRISDGEVEVAHFDAEARLEDYARRLRSDATFVHVALYFESFLTSIPFVREKDGTYCFGFPQEKTPLAGVAVEDIGGVVAAIFERPSGFKGRRVGIVGDDLPPQAYARALTRILDTSVIYKYVPRGVFALLDLPRAHDLADMFEFHRRYVPNRRDDLFESRWLYPPMRTFEAWAEVNKDSFTQKTTWARMGPTL